MRVIYDVTPQVIPGVEKPTVPEGMLTPGLREEELEINWEDIKRVLTSFFEMSGHRQYLKLLEIFGPRPVFYFRFSLYILYTHRLPAVYFIIVFAQDTTKYLANNIFWKTNAIVRAHLYVVGHFCFTIPSLFFTRCRS